ncbi:MAG: copper transport protein, partial [Thermomicrobiales bacterium]|nr:copper transport protein [Thermomicrobiales bacterium]
NVTLLSRARQATPLQAHASHPYRWRALVAALALFLALALHVQPASAHAFLESSDPPANSVMALWPQQVTMRFTEPLEHSYTRAELYDQTGTKVPGTSFQFDDSDRNVLMLSIPSNLPNGTYTVVYRTLSAADGHDAHGYFAFTIGTQADVVNVIPPATTDSSGPPEWLRTVSRWIPLLGLAVSVAVWPIWLLVLRPGISPAWQAGPELTRRVRRLATGGVVVAVAGSVLALLVQADGARDGNSLLDATRTTLTDTRYGRIWVYRIVLIFLFAAVLSLCAWWWPRRRRWLAATTLLLAAALPIPFSLIAHAAAQPTGRTAAVAFDVVHLLGASIWVGGLFLLGGALVPTLRDLTPTGRRVVLARTIPRFSVVALTAWGVMGITGLYNAWLQVGNLKGLRETAYGHSLIAKLLLLVPLLLLAASNLLVVGPRLKRGSDDRASTAWSRRFAILVGAELVLVVAVLLVVGRLTSQPPARETLVQEAGQVTLHLEAQGRSGTLAIAPAVTGPNHYRLDLGGDALPDQTEALLRLTMPNVQTGQKEVKLSRIGSTAFEAHGSELSVAGDWQIQVIVRKVGEFQWQASTSIPIKTTASSASLPRPAWRFTSSAGIAGLALLVAGLAGLSLAWYAGRTPLRKESAGLGMVALALGAVLLLQGRTNPGGTAVALTARSPVVADQASVTRGKEIFMANCAVCHGATGRGDGPAAANLDPPYPPPANFHTTHALAHYDGEFFNWIKNGKINTAMPAFGGQLSDEDIWNVVNYIRWLQQNPDAAEPAAASPIASPIPAGTPQP